MTDDVVIDTGKGVLLRLELTHRAPDGSLLVGGVTDVQINESEMTWYPAPAQLDQLENWARVLFPGAKVSTSRRERVEKPIVEPAPLELL